MSHRIPVYYFGISKEMMPTALETWHDAEELIVQAMEAKKAWETTSTNWHFQYIIEILGKQANIADLAFLNKEIVCLQDKEILLSLKALDILINFIKSNNVDLTMINDFLEGDIKINIQKISINMKRRNKQIDDDTAKGFILFLKSLIIVMQECLINNECFLYVQPQP